MKNLIQISTMATATIISSLGSLNSFAVVNCAPLVADMKVQEQVVADSTYQIDKIQRKIIKLEDQISQKSGLISSVQDQIDSEKNQIDLKLSDKQSLINSIQDIKAEKQDLIAVTDSMLNRIASLKVEIDNLPARSTAKRMALREMKRTEVKVGKKQSQIQALDAEILPVVQSISSLEQSIEESELLVLSLKSEKKDIKIAAPTLKTLRNLKKRQEDKISSQSSIQEQNMSLLVELTQKAEMCKTYKVKYPLSLKIAKEIYEVGCEQYEIKSFKGKYKQDAQMETLEMICSDI